MAEQLGPFLGAGRESGDLLSISQFINQGVGSTTEVYAEKPAKAKALIVVVITDAVRICVGDYRKRNFADGDVNVGADTITIASGAAFNADADDVLLDPYKLTTTGVVPAGLDLTTVYSLRRITAGPDVLAFYTNDADARADTNRVDITAAAGGGTHSLGSIPTQAAATIQDGFGVFEVPGAAGAGNGIYKFAAPDRITFIGDQVGAQYNYFWA